MLNILVTGGAGYIGSHVVKKLGELGHKLTIVDNLSTGKKSSVLYGELIELDISNVEQLESLFSQNNFDACFHFAGSIVVPESVSNPIKYYENNTQNTFELLKLCQTYNVNKFIFSSTAAVYGDAEGGVCKESTPIQPLNPYGKTKYMTEWMLEDFSNAYSNFNYVAFRYFNVAGANVDGKIGQSTPNATHLIKVASELAAGKRESMSVFGTDYNTPDGTCIRDYIHVDDLAQAHIDGLNYLNDGGTSDVFNCGYSEGYSVLEVLKTMEEVVGEKLNYTESERRPGDAAKLISKADRIREKLNWTPKFNDLKLICKTAYEWELKL